MELDAASTGERIAQIMVRADKTTEAAITGWRGQ
jgi:hypothetical protein